MPLARRTSLLLIGSALAGALLLAVFPFQASASTTTLRVLSGSATVVQPATASRPAVDGETLANGDEVTTGPDGHALLAFVNGSTLSLEPGTTVAVAEVSSHPAATVTRLVQTAGRTWSSVQRLASARSRYEIRTPSVTATVRGTAFEVDVAADGATRIHTVDGAVHVENGFGEVVVVAGNETTATPQAPPAPPSAAPPSTLKTFDIGNAPIVVVDEVGRSCGRRNDQLLQQIPGCVVRDGQIRITGASAAGRLTAVTTAPSADEPIVERVTAPGAAAAVVRDVDVVTGAAAPQVIVVTARPQPAPTTRVDLPLIGSVPVLQVLPTFAPRTSVETAKTASPIATFPVLVPTLAPLPALATPVPAIAVPTAAPTSALPTAVVTAAPTLEVSAPTVAPTIAPLPTVAPTALSTVTPTVPSTAAPTAIVTLAPTAVPTIAPTAIPAAVPTAAPTAAPTAIPTAVPPAPATPVPTAVPTTVPAPIQTAVPTVVPIVVPTAVPTVLPTVAPLPTVGLP